MIFFIEKPEKNLEQKWHPGHRMDRMDLIDREHLKIL
jgi:hypothetical protein